MTTSPIPSPGPSRFRWGASSAAFQIEGAAHLDGRTDSIWDLFCRVPGAVLDDHDGEVACDHYFRSAQDVGLMRGLNLGAYRFATSWSRVRPSGGVANRRGLDFYSRLVDELLTHDIEPWVTLYHWDLPQAIEERGGWADRETAHRFVDYALTVHDALGDRVNVWTTINEPWCAAFLGYGNGLHAPGRTDRHAALAAAHHLLLAHGMAATELRSRSRDATIAISLGLEVVDPADPEDPDDAEAARRVDGQLNRIFLDPLFRGAYPDDVLADTAHLGLTDHIRGHDMQTICAPIDLLGVDYFHGRTVSRRRQAVPSHTRPLLHRQTENPLPAADDIFDVPKNLPTTAVGREIQPEGLTRLLLRLQAEYTGPARVGLAVENGAAFEDVITPDGRVDDPRRREYLERHIRAMQVAMAQGADVRAYFVRSLLDDFEWAWGYSRRYGLVHVDFATQERVVKSSGEWYAKVAAGMPLPPDSEEIPG